MDILDDMGASKLSAKVFLKVNYPFKNFQFSEHFYPWLELHATRTRALCIVQVYSEKPYR